MFGGICFIKQWETGPLIFRWDAVCRVGPLGQEIGFWIPVQMVPQSGGHNSIPYHGILYIMDILQDITDTTNPTLKWLSTILRDFSITSSFLVRGRGIARIILSSLNCCTSYQTFPFSPFCCRKSSYRWPFTTSSSLRAQQKNIWAFLHL
jgi:hypothetical protein